MEFASAAVEPPEDRERFNGIPIFQAQLNPQTLPPQTSPSPGKNHVCGNFAVQHGAKEGKHILATLKALPMSRRKNMTNRTPLTFPVKTDKRGKNLLFYKRLLFQICVSKDSFHLDFNSREDILLPSYNLEHSARTGPKKWDVHHPSLHTHKIHNIFKGFVLGRLFAHVNLV